MGLRHKTPTLLLVSGCGPDAGAADSIGSLLENEKVDSASATGEASEEARANSTEDAVDAADAKAPAKQKKKRSKGTCLSLLWTKYAQDRLLKQSQCLSILCTRHAQKGY